MEIKNVYVKTRAEFGKQCIFDTYGPSLDEEIRPCPDEMNDYIVRSHCHAGVQHSKQLALHEVQTEGTSIRNSGMFHFEGGWPKEINPRDEETTARFRRRVEKDDEWAPKLRNLLKIAEHGVLQNSAVNIYEHYFDEMVPTSLVEPLDLRTVNVYADPQKPARPVNDISWSPDSGSRIVVSYCFLDFGHLPDYSNTAYIWQVENPNVPYMALEAFCPCVASEFNPRDPSVLASGLMSGQVCNWDTRTGTTPVQLSHRQFSHRDYTNAIKWLPTKSNTEFFSTSSDGHAMWWDTRRLREPTEVLMFDLENPNEPDIDRAIGVSSVNFGPVVGTKFMFGMENGIVLIGSRKAKTNAEKLALRFKAHYGPVISVDRNVFSPAIFLSVGDWSVRIWAEDTKEGSLTSTRFLNEYPTGGCWNKSKHSVFYIITGLGLLTAWDVLRGLDNPVLTIQLCEEKLTTMAPHEEGSFLAIGNSVGKVYLVESTESLQSFDKKDRVILLDYLERSSRFMKAVDTRLKEIKLTQNVVVRKVPATVTKEPKSKKKPKPTKKPIDERGDQQKDSGVSMGKERGKKGAPKDRRKIKDEFPELAEVEEKYFEIVEKEKEKYGLDDQTHSKRSHHSSTIGRKPDAKKIDKKQETTKDEEKSAKQNRRGKQGTVKILKTTKEASSREKRRRKTSTEIPPIASTESIVKETPAAAISSKLISKTKRRKGGKTIEFELARPCGKEICKPKVCCSRPSLRRKLRFSERIRDRRTEDEGTSRMGKGMEDDDRKSKKSKTGVKSEVVGRLEERGLRKITSTKREDGPLAPGLMDGLGTVDRRMKFTGRAKIRILREMLAPPGFLTDEVERARRENREGRLLTAKTKRRYIVRRIPPGRAKQRAKKRMSLESKADQKSRREDKAEGMVEMEETVDRATRVGKKSPTALPDPCAPPESRTVTEEFEALLGGPVLKPIEGKSELGKGYLEEMEEARRRVYPRISEFHSIE